MPFAGFRIPLSTSTIAATSTTTSTIPSTTAATTSTTTTLPTTTTTLPWAALAAPDPQPILLNPDLGLGEVVITSFCAEATTTPPIQPGSEIARALRSDLRLVQAGGLDLEVPGTVEEDPRCDAKLVLELSGRRIMARYTGGGWMNRPCWNGMSVWGSWDLYVGGTWARSWPYSYEKPPPETVGVNACADEEDEIAFGDGFHDDVLFDTMRGFADLMTANLYAGERFETRLETEGLTPSDAAVAALACALDTSTAFVDVAYSWARVEPGALEPLVPYLIRALDDPGDYRNLLRDTLESITGTRDQFEAWEWWQLRIADGADDEG